MEFVILSVYCTSLTFHHVGIIFHHSLKLPVGFKSEQRSCTAIMFVALMLSDYSEGSFPRHTCLLTFRKKAFEDAKPLLHLIAS